MNQGRESSRGSPSFTDPGSAIEVAAGLIFRDGHLLITQRHAGAHLGGFWEFPGGKRESHESFEECLRRELKEELGIEIDIHELVESITHHYPEKTVTLKFFRCRLKEHEPRPLGCPAFCWVSMDELANYEFPAADARLLQRLRHSVEWWKR
jgi:8-oxo-dGTP diphosphatase